MVFEVAAGGHQDGDQGSGAEDFQSESGRRAHGQFSRQVAPPRPSEGHRRDWKKAYVKLAEGEKMIEYAENL